MFLTPADRVREFEERGWWRGESVDALTRRAVAQGGSSEALVDPFNRRSLDGRDPERLTWEALDERVDRLASVLLSEGLRKDDIVLAQLPNTIDAVLLFLACARLGAVLSPVAMPYRAHELEFIVEKLAPRFFVTVAAFAGFDHAEQGRAIAATPGGPQLLLFAEGADGLYERAASAEPARTWDHVAANPVAGGRHGAPSA